MNPVKEIKSVTSNNLYAIIILVNSVIISCISTDVKIRIFSLNERITLLSFWLSTATFLFTHLRLVLCMTQPWRHRHSGVTQDQIESLRMTRERQMLEDLQQVTRQSGDLERRGIRGETPVCLSRPSLSLGVSVCVCVCPSVYLFVLLYEPFRLSELKDVSTIQIYYVLLHYIWTSMVSTCDYHFIFLSKVRLRYLC